jgi:hypothetical protein
MIATAHALKYLRDNPQLPPPPYPQQESIDNLRERIIDWDSIFDEVLHSEQRPPVVTFVGKALWFICFLVNFPRSLLSNV